MKSIMLKIDLEMKLNKYILIFEFFVADFCVVVKFYIFSIFRNKKQINGIKSQSMF